MIEGMESRAAKGKARISKKMCQAERQTDTVIPAAKLFGGKSAC
jgi:hypothetical protein